MSILINRLILGLRQIGNGANDTDVESLSLARFASGSILGNIGAPLRAGGDEDEDEESPAACDGPPVDVDDQTHSLTA